MTLPLHMRFWKFIGESTKNYERMKQALSNKNMADLCNVATKMLPTFTMIEARKAIPALQWLEFHRGNTDLSDEARQHADEALSCIADVIKEAKKVLKRREGQLKIVKKTSKKKNLKKQSEVLCLPEKFKYGLSTILKKYYLCIRLQPWNTRKMN